MLCTKSEFILTILFASGLHKFAIFMGCTVRRGVHFFKVCFSYSN